jgi:hypothetical protein
MFAARGAGAPFDFLRLPLTGVVGRTAPRPPKAAGRVRDVGAERRAPLSRARCGGFQSVREGLSIRAHPTPPSRQARASQGLPGLPGGPRKPRRACRLAVRSTRKRRRDDRPERTLTERCVSRVESVRRLCGRWAVWPGRRGPARRWGRSRGRIVFRRIGGARRAPPRSSCAAHMGGWRSWRRRSRRRR